MTRGTTGSEVGGWWRCCGVSIERRSISAAGTFQWLKVKDSPAEIKKKIKSDVIILKSQKQVNRIIFISISDQNKKRQANEKS